MSKKFKVLLSISILLNVLFFLGSAVALQQKGGLPYLVNKANVVLGKADANPPYYLERTSLFDNLPSTQKAIVFLLECSNTQGTLTL